MSMKNSSDAIGNRTRDLPSCSAVPQPTATPRAPKPNKNIPSMKIRRHKPNTLPYAFHKYILNLKVKVSNPITALDRP